MPCRAPIRAQLAELVFPQAQLVAVSDLLVGVSPIGSIPGAELIRKRIVFQPTTGRDICKIRFIWAGAVVHEAASGWIAN